VDQAFNNYGAIRRARRALMIELFGGKCIKCSSTKVLEFDHINPDSKEFEISNLWQPERWMLLFDELKKCQLLCHSCHGSKSSKEHRKKRTITRRKKVRRND
jgi:5-methylcytosine-specific restriction endonuclease McrA